MSNALTTGIWLCSTKNGTLLGKPIRFVVLLLESSQTISRKVSENRRILSREIDGQLNFLEEEGSRGRFLLFSRGRKLPSKKKRSFLPKFSKGFKYASSGKIRTYCFRFHSRYLHTHSLSLSRRFIAFQLSKLTIHVRVADFI